MENIRNNKLGEQLLVSKLLAYSLKQSIQTKVIRNNLLEISFG